AARMNSVSGTCVPKNCACNFWGHRCLTPNSFLPPSLISGSAILEWDLHRDRGVPGMDAVLPVRDAGSLGCESRWMIFRAWNPPAHRPRPGVSQLPDVFASTFR